MRVAAGDVNGDGFADIITGAGPGAGPHIKVFDGQTNDELRSFFAFNQNFGGGVFVASGDLHSAMQPRRLDLDLAINAASGADEVLVQLSPMATVELLQKVRINTGAGPDSVLFDAVCPSDPSIVGMDHRIDTGGDDDVVDFRLRTVPGQAIGPNGPQPQQLNVKTVINTDGGNDRANFDWLVHTDRQLTSAVELLTGSGHDVTRFRIAESVIPRPRNRVFSNYDYFHDAGSGHDDVQFQILPYIEQDNIYRFRFELGAGNDGFQGNWVFGTELPAVQLNERMVVAMSVAGQEGNDNIAVIWSELFQPNQIQASQVQASQSPLARRLISFDLDGGHGNDRVALDFQGTILDGQAVDAALCGGAGEDVVQAMFNLDPRSTGWLRAEVHGDGGNDELALEIFGADRLAELFALLDGGPGKDKCKTTRNVVVRNCP